MTPSMLQSLEFSLPTELEAHEPPEARGLTRDNVRLMVSRSADNSVVHTRFPALPDYLRPGDVLIVNSSATLNAAFAAEREAAHGGTADIRLHLSTQLSGNRWVVELRRLSGNKTTPLLDAERGERIRLAAGAHATLLDAYARVKDELANAPARLWIAKLTVPIDTLSYSARYGFPIRYHYVPGQWPLHYYQTIFAREPGSTEMPSAGRPFTHDLVRRLVAAGIRVEPIVLHAGVASLETGELPYPERFRVPQSTADVVNDARANGGRIVAVGTTVVRALETAAGSDGSVRAQHGWTDLVITPERGMHVVDALLTGLHAPRASHLAMLEALAGIEHLAIAYEAAVRNRYLWHEFGDLHLLLPAHFN